MFLCKHILLYYELWQAETGWNNSSGEPASHSRSWSSGLFCPRLRVLVLPWCSSLLSHAQTNLLSISLHSSFSLSFRHPQPSSLFAHTVHLTRVMNSEASAERAPRPRRPSYFPQKEEATPEYERRYGDFTTIGKGALALTALIPKGSTLLISSHHE